MNGTTHGGLTPPISVISQENASHAGLQNSLKEAFLNLFPDDPTLSWVDIKSNWASQRDASRVKAPTQIWPRVSPQGIHNEKLELGLCKLSSEFRTHKTDTKMQFFKEIK